MDQSILEADVGDVRSVERLLRAQSEAGWHYSRSAAALRREQRLVTLAFRQGVVCSYRVDVVPPAKATATELYDQPANVRIATMAKCGFDLVDCFPVTLSSISVHDQSAEPHGGCMLVFALEVSLEIESAVFKRGVAIAERLSPVLYQTLISTEHDLGQGEFTTISRSERILKITVREILRLDDELGRERLGDLWEEIETPALVEDICATLLPFHMPDSPQELARDILVRQEAALVNSVLEDWEGE